MVLTRAQAAAQAAQRSCIATQVDTEDSAIMEETALVELPSEMQLSPAVFNSGAGSHLVDLVQHFIAQTQTLAAELTFLQYRQQGQSDAQSAALMAVQASTEANMQQLTNQQRLIAERLGEALTAMQNELQEQFQRLQLLERERSSQIETFVNEKLALALQEVQQESHASQMAIATQTDGTRARFDEIETKITSSLEAITTHIHQMVDAKFVAMQEEVGPDGNTDQLVQRLVEAASASATDDIKKTLEADLVRLRDEMQREISSGVEVPVREYVRQLVLELMDHSESKLESRVQRALMNTQAELNLQVQRQADAMSILREQLQRHRAQVSNSIDKAVIKAAIKDVLRSEDYVKAEHECENDCIRNAHGDVDHSNFAAQINSTIERSLQAAATTIASAIKAGIRNTDSRSERSSFHDLGYDDNEEEEKMSAEDIQLEQRIQDAWRRTYFNNTDESTDTPSVECSGLPDRYCLCQRCAVDLVQAGPSVHEATTYCYNQCDAVPHSANVVLVLQRSKQQDVDHPQAHRADVGPPDSRPRNTLPVLPSRVQPLEVRQPRRHRSPTRASHLQRVVSEQQQQVVQRAELAAQQHTSRK